MSSCRATNANAMFGRATLIRNAVTVDMHEDHRRMWNKVAEELGRVANAIRSGRLRDI